MEALFESLIQFLTAGWYVLINLFIVLVPWSPLMVWIAFWMCAVNWVPLRRVLLSGGWVGLVLVGLFMIIVWGTVAPPESGYHHMFQLKLSNFVGKTVYVTALFCIMLLSGSVQLSGALGNCCASFPAEAPVEEPPGHH